MTSPMKAQVLLVFLFALGSSSARAGLTPIPIQNQPENCVLDSNDPYDPGNWDDGKIRKGPHRGECLETRTKRSIRILSQRERAQYGIAARDARIAIANFSHDGKFWIALINPRAIEETVFQIEYFPAIIPAAHNQLRFIFSERSPVVLIPQKNPHGKRLSLRNIVYSNEAVMKASGDAFDVWSGLWRNYGLSHRFVSLADQYRAMVVNQNHRVKQIPLKLSAKDSAAVLVRALNVSHSEGMTKLYNTVAKSCGTELFSVLDKALGIRVTTLHRRIISVLSLAEVLTTEVERALWARKLYSRKLKRPDLAQDTGFLLEWNALNDGSGD